MIKSMTGFGKAVGTSTGNMISVEIRALNSKFLELSIRLPAGYRDHDMELRSSISKEAERGKVDINVVLEPIPGSKRSMINRSVVSSYFNDLKSIKKETGIEAKDPLDVILRFANVLNNEKAESNPKEWKLIDSLVRKALKDFTNFRIREGKALQKDIEARANKITKLLSTVEKNDPLRVKNVRARLKKSFDDNEDNINVDKNRFEQELIYYLEKLDINEEKVRLKSHLSYLLESLKTKESNGKKLGFIMQEVGREINTVGSKANDAQIQRKVVEMKDELEKMKEQIANII
jgi:uncharacterized protein (TIGR00255 family)